jgi:hypothetical protein
MTMHCVGPFPGLKINNEIRRQMTLDITNTREKFPCNNPPLSAVKTARIASKIIRHFIDQMNLQHKLNYQLSYEVLSEINQLFLESGYNLECLIKLTFFNIECRANPYPLRSLNYEIIHHRIDYIRISCSEIW